MTIARHILVAALALATIQTAHGAEVAAVVANRTIYPGQAVGADQVSNVALDRCDECVPGYVVDTRTIVGKIANKTILPNRLIYPEAFRSPAIITKGAATTLVYRSSGLTISVKAMSLKDAAIGDPVSVRSLLNGSIVTGVTQADGSVLASGS